MYRSGKLLSRYLALKNPLNLKIKMALCHYPFFFYFTDPKEELLFLVAREETITCQQREKFKYNFILKKKLMFILEINISLSVASSVSVYGSFQLTYLMCIRPLSYCM